MRRPKHQSQFLHNRAILAQAISCSSNPLQQFQLAWVEQVSVLFVSLFCVPICAVAILVQAILLEFSVVHAQSSGVLFSVQWRLVRVPRRGWQAIEVPSGWYEVIRGPRPQAQKWPFAPSRQPTQQSRQSQSGPASARQGGRWGPRRGAGSVGRQELHQSRRVRASPEVVLSSAGERVVKLEAALAALGVVGGPEVILLQSSLKSAKRAAQEPALDVQLSQCEQFVARAQKRLAAHDEERVPQVSELQEGESRLARLREAAPVARDVPVPQAVQPDAGVQVARLEEMVKVQDERDALLATRPGSCGAFPLPESLSELSTLVEMKTKELTNALFQELTESPDCLQHSPSGTRSMWCRTVRQSKMQKKEQCRAHQSHPWWPTGSAEQGVVLFLSMPTQVDGEHGGSRLPLARRITTWGFRGVRVGQASHLGPPRRHMSRPIEGRDVTPRVHPAVGATQVDEDSDVLDVRHVSQRPRRGRRRVSSDSDVPLVRGSVRSFDRK